MSEKMTPIRQLKLLDFRVKQDPAVAAVWRQCPKGHLGRAGPSLAALAHGGARGTPVAPAGPPCASVLCAAAVTAQHAQHSALLLLLFYGFTDFFSDVTHKIASDGELLHLEFHLTQLPKRILSLLIMELKTSYNSGWQTKQPCFNGTVLTDFTRS